MTRSGSPSSPHGPITILTLHGFPRLLSRRPWEWETPSHQFEAMRQRFPSPLISWDHFAWAGATRRELILPGQLLQEGGFAEKYAGHFEEWLQRRLPTIPSDNPIILLSYSLGSLILFHWLAYMGSVHTVRRVTTIFTLAGPHRFVKGQQGVFFESLPSHEFIVKAETIPPQEITKNLRPWQLVVLLAGKDGTWLRGPHGNTLFHEQKSIDQHVIRTATHDNLCAHKDALAYIEVRFPPQ